MSLAHSNASHSLYLALGPAPGPAPSVQGVEGVMVREDSAATARAQSTEHARDWILLPVTFQQLKQVFRSAASSYFAFKMLYLSNANWPTILHFNISMSNAFVLC